MSKPEPRSECPISGSLDMWGDKWSLLIIRDLMFAQKNTYGEFLKSDEKISTNILAARLLALEEAGIVEKLDHPDSKAKIWYQLTPKGIDLLPLIVEISVWAAKYSAIPDGIQRMLDAMKKDKEGALRAKMDELTAMRKVV
jgi:DNA-binding HxlR family transcriptional regulator